MASLQHAAANVVIAPEALLQLRNPDLGDDWAAMGTAGPVIRVVQSGEERPRLALGEIVVCADARVAGRAGEQRILEGCRRLPPPMERELLDEVGNEARKLRRREVREQR